MQKIPEIMEILKRQLGEFERIQKEYEDKNAEAKAILQQLEDKIAELEKQRGPK